MRLIDADLLEMKLRDKAKELEQHWTIMARAYEDAADMVRDTKAISRTNADISQALVAAFNLGYQTASETTENGKD